MENSVGRVPIRLCEKRAWFLGKNASFSSNKKNASLDRISWLPEHIILKILDCLPVEDAVRTSVLSKTWKGFCCSYPIVPNLSFDHNKFGLKFLLAAGETGQEPDIDEIRERFVNFVDRQLSNIKKRKLSVRKVALNVAIHDSKFFSRVDHLMELVKELCEVEELCFFVQTNDSKWESEIESEDVCYLFPLSVLGSKGLRSLNARGCKFAGLVNNTPVPFSSLQQLCLSQCELNEDAVINLACCCPGIESLEFKDCTFWMYYLKLSEFKRLKKAFILTPFGWLINIDFEGTILENFECDANIQLECEFTAAACGRIRELTLMGCTVNQPNLFAEPTNAFPFLEEAHLSIDQRELTMEEGAQRLRAANHYLRRLSFSEPPFVTNHIKEINIDCPNLEWFKFLGRGPKEVYINCPNLRQFCYAGDAIPMLPIFITSAAIKDIYFQFGPIIICDDSWFIQLRRLIQQLGEVGRIGCVIHLHLWFCLKMVEFVPKEFGAIQEASQLNNIHLEMSLKFINCMNVAPFVDGLIWSTRPTTLIIRGHSYMFIKDVCEKIDMKSRGETCKEFCNECWWHHVQGFEVESSFRNFDNVNEAFTELHGRFKASYFKFKWSSNLTLPATRQPEFLLESHIPVEKKTPGVFCCHGWDGSRWI